MELQTSKTVGRLRHAYINNTQVQENLVFPFLIHLQIYPAYLTSSRRNSDNLALHNYLYSDRESIIFLSHA